MTDDEVVTGGRARRTTRSRERRRRARARAAVVTVAVLAVAGAVLVTFQLGGGGTGGEPAATVSAPGALPGVAQPVVTVVTRDEDGGDDAGDRGDVVGSVAVLAVDRDGGEGTVLLVPPATVVEVPGHGPLTLREAFALGGGPLLGVSLDAALGIRSDAVASVDRTDWERLLTHLEVEEELAPSFAAVGDASEPDLQPVVAAAYLALLDRIVEAGEALGDALGAVEVALEAPGGRGGPDADGGGLGPEVLHTVLAELAASRAEGHVATVTLTVVPAEEPAGTYAIDRPATTALVAERFAAARVDPGVGAGRPVQVLDGNDLDGVHDLVARVLEPVGYEILLTGNADRPDHEVTRIVVHDDDPGTLAAARDVRERLGTGTIERAGTPLTVVELTIVVGLDFPVGGAGAG